MNYETIPVPELGESYHDWLHRFEPALARRFFPSSPVSPSEVDPVEVEADAFRAGCLSALHDAHNIRFKHGPDANVLGLLHVHEEALLERRRSVIAASLVPRLLAAHESTEGPASGAQQLAEQHPDGEPCNEPCACWQDGYEAGFDDALDDTPEKP